MNLFDLVGKEIIIIEENVDHYLDWPELNGNRGFDSGQLCEGAVVKILKVEISPWGNPEIVGVTAIEFNGKVYEYTKEMFESPKTAYWCFWTKDDKSEFNLKPSEVL
jgi:hypothetical protein